MRKLDVSLQGKSVELQVPSDWESDVGLLFGLGYSANTEFCTRLSVIAGDDGRYEIREDCAKLSVIGDLSRSEALMQLSEIVASRLAAGIYNSVALHAGAVVHGGHTILIPGQSGAGKSSLTAWLVDRGFAYLTDELSTVAAQGMVEGLPRALMLKGSDDLLSKLPHFATAPNLRCGESRLFRPEDAENARPAAPCGLIIFPTFTPGADLTIRPLTPGKACLGLMGCNVNSRNLADGGFAVISAIAKLALAIELSYGAFDQLDGVIDTLAHLVLDTGLDGDRGRKFISAFMGSSSTKPAAPASVPPTVRHEIPAPTPRRAPAKLTIGMATYDDYDGVYFSIQALRLYHPEIAGDAEFIVVDNHPDGASAAALKALEKDIPNYRYIPEATRSGTFVKSRVFDEASAEFVLCMDSHVFVLPGAIRKLLGYFIENPATPDLLQGPLLYDDLGRVSTHFRPEWSGGMYGVWDNNGLADNPDAPPFEIPMQGMGLFACRRKAWRGFNEAFRGFGGEEWYIHEKYRKAGARVLCLPFLRWVHRFNRPNGIPYRNTLEDRAWNYLVGFDELGLSTDAMEAHFRELIGEPRGGEILSRLKDELVTLHHS